VKNRKLWIALLTAMGVLLVAVFIAHVTGHPVTAAAARHPGKPWWLLYYYASWLAFCVWLVTHQRHPRARGILFLLGQLGQVRVGESWRR
jgi:hypothetical protein